MRVLYVLAFPLRLVSDPAVRPDTPLTYEAVSVEIQATFRAISCTLPNERVTQLSDTLGAAHV